MKKSRNRIVSIVLGLILLYVFLLCLLLNVESENSGFSGVSDAIWYLLATLTTVGYGDIAPVTPLGRFVGAILMLMSAGVMAWLIGLMVSLFYGRLYPDFWLWKNRKRKWYIFNKLEARTCKLAYSLAATDPDAAWIFLGKVDALSNDIGSSLKSVLITDSSIEAILNRKRSDAQCFAFVLGENSWDNISCGNNVLSLVQGKYPVKVICEAESVLDDIPDGIKLVNHNDLIARSYWINNQVKPDEKSFVLIGDGHLAELMLEIALRNNVFRKDQSLKYYLFGDWVEFKNNHHELDKFISLNHDSENGDSLCFSDGTWNTAPEILENADRIIICSDDMDKNASISAELIKFFPTNAQIHVCAQAAPSVVSCFGTDDEIMSGKLIMSDYLDQIAIRLNDMYRKKTGAGSPFNELSVWHKASNIASADHLRVKIGILLPNADTRFITEDLCREAALKFKGLSEEEKDQCRWIEHERWCRFHYLHNWKFNEKRDNKLRRHPLLNPYEELTDNEKRLDDSSWEIIGDLAESLGEEIL